MKKQIKGWVVTNVDHPRQVGDLMVMETFSHTRKGAIEKFVAGSGLAWSYWRKKYNFRCERATQIIETITKQP